jgi:hypothetical protein
MRQFPRYTLSELLAEDAELLHLVTIERMAGGEHG